MEEGVTDCVKEQLHSEMTMKIEVEEAAQSSAHVGTEMDGNRVGEEPGLVQFLKSEPALLLKEEILEGSRHPGNRQQCVQVAATLASTGSVDVARSASLGGLLFVKYEPSDLAIGPTVLQNMDMYYTINKARSHTPTTSTRAIVGWTSVSADDVEQRQLLHIKEEPEDADLDVGPTMLQHMDSHYRSHQIDLNAIKQENTIRLDAGEVLSGIKDGQEVHSQVRDVTIEDSQKASHKYSCQKMTEDDYDEAHVKSCLRQQKNLQHHSLLQPHKNRSNSFKCDRTLKNLHLLSAQNKVKQGNGTNNSVTTRSVIATSSNQNRDEMAKTKLKQNMRVHNGEKPHRCDTCDARFTDKCYLIRHMRGHTGEKPYQCTACDARFAQRGGLTSHIRVHTGEKPYQCDTCDTRFAQSNALTIHMRVHTGEKPYQCTTCDARFAQRGGLTSHMRVHTGEKPYQCDTCDARCAKSCDLISHMRVHTGEKPYQCTSCDSRFALSGALTKHIRVHTGEKPYQCTTCDARFAQRSGLTSHIRVHTVDKPFQCDTCDAKFARRGGLTSHIRVHTVDKPYQCDTCDAKFVHSSNLAKHKKVHMSKKPFECSECGTKFARKYDLQKHTRRLHPK